MIRRDDSTRDPDDPGQTKPSVQFLVEPPQPDAGKGWDEAHATLAASPDFHFAEPEIESARLFYPSDEQLATRGGLLKNDYLQFIDYWPSPAQPAIWHLDDEYSQLRPAREFVAKAPAARTVRIAHLDTGYRKDNMCFPPDDSRVIRHDLQRNFVDGEEGEWNSAEDPLFDGTLKMPGHGTGTLSILAGTHVDLPYYHFDDYIGLHAPVEIVPIRIARSVVLFKSGAFVRAMEYILNELNGPDSNASTRIHVITMSMGGLPSNAWADVVNQVYEKGIFMVTAAGNNFDKLPTRTMVYPARFNRVVAACGVTYDGSPYAKPPFGGSVHIMEGNYGPQALMKTAVAAFTPNVPWATWRFGDIVGIRGDGTSSATPQVASAAALYYSLHYDELQALPEPWMRVEAIRHALFSTTKKEINDHDGDFTADYKKYFGNGILQARAMLDVNVSRPAPEAKQPPDRVSLPFLRLILGLRAIEETPDESAEDAMLETELVQLILSTPQLQDLLGNEEKDLSSLDRDEQLKFAGIVIDDTGASDRLKERMRLLVNQLNLE
jgi:hypothetical protein